MKLLNVPPLWPLSTPLTVAPRLSPGDVHRAAAADPGDKENGARVREDVLSESRKVL